MKKRLTLTLALALILSLTACGGGKTGDGTNSDTPGGGESSISKDVQEEVQYYKVGDTVSTDIFEFTLEDANLALALNNGLDENYFTAKEYDPEKDAKNPYVAPKGHTYVAFTYTVNNLDRASADFYKGSTISVEYDGEKYSGKKDGAYYLHQEGMYLDANGKTQTEKANTWYRKPSINLLLQAGGKETRRAYLDMSVDVGTLKDEFKFIVDVLNADGTTESFVYLISE